MPLPLALRPAPPEIALGCPAFPDNGIGAISCGELLVQALVKGLLRSPVGECRMETNPIVPELDVPCNVLPCFLPCRISSPVNALDFQRGIERFRQAVVEAYPVRPTDWWIPSRSSTAANSPEV